VTFLEEFRKHMKARDYDAALKLLRADPREVEMLRLENEHLRAALKRIVDLRHLSSTREMAEIAAFALRTHLRSLPRPVNTAALHAGWCEWHHDQYDAECTCGAAGNLLASQVRENNDVEVLIHVLMHQSDANDLDAVVRELGIEDSDKTPADAVRDLREQLANARSDAALFTEHEKAERRRELEKVRP
jgi:hypothetical protein